jgi:hypothetical protein
VWRFVADQPGGTTTDRDVYTHFGRLPAGTVHNALLVLANAGRIDLSEAGTRLTARGMS